RGTHVQAKMRVLGALGGNELQEARLRDHENVGIARLQPAQIKRLERTIRGLNGRPVNLAVTQLMKRRGQADFIPNLQHRGMNGLAPEIATAVFVGLKQRHGNPATRQQQRQHCSTRPRTDDTARGLMRLAHLSLGGRCGHGLAGWWNVHGPGSFLSSLPNAMILRLPTCDSQSSTSHLGGGLGKLYAATHSWRSSSARRITRATRSSGVVSSASIFSSVCSIGNRADPFVSASNLPFETAG